MNLRPDYCQLKVHHQFFPLTRDLYLNLENDSISYIDQLIFRFSKLQDEIGTNTFRYFLEFLKEDIEGKPFRDILTILERINFIECAETWDELRELRNVVTHEYPTLIDETIEKLNQFYIQIPVLENVLSVIKNKLSDIN